jgi:hypothetical protein
LQRSKLKYDEPLSSFAYNFNFRRYHKASSGFPHLRLVLKHD